MEDALARQLAALTRRFYEGAARSFSATRQHPWEGWERLWRKAVPWLGAPSDGRPLRVLDVGCGNLRFERFLAEKAPGAVEAWGIDSCPALMAEGIAAIDADAGQDATAALDAATGQDATAALDGAAAPGVGTAFGRAPAGAPAPRAHLREMDVAAALLDGVAPDALAARFGAPPVDLAVAFGLFHHVPTASARERLMRALVGSVRPGGLVAASLWQFARDPRLRAKAEQATARGCAQLGLLPLPPGDYLMGWQDQPGAFRYCHSFDEADVDALAAAACAPAPGAASPLAREAARFSADGKSGQLNRYLLLERL